MLEEEDDGADTGEEEEEIPVDDGEGAAGKRMAKDAKDEASESTSLRSPRR